MTEPSLRSTSPPGRSPRRRRSFRRHRRRRRQLARVTDLHDGPRHLLRPRPREPRGARGGPCRAQRPPSRRRPRTFRSGSMRGLSDAGDTFTFATDAGDLDVLGRPAGTRGLTTSFETRERLEIDGREILVAEHRRSDPDEARGWTAEGPHRDRGARRIAGGSGRVRLTASGGQPSRRYTRPSMAHVFVAPHPDDVALSCGGLIASLRELGQNVTILTVFSGSGSSNGGVADGLPARGARVRHEDPVARHRGVQSGEHPRRLPGDRGRRRVARRGGPARGDPGGRRRVREAVLAARVVVPPREHPREVARRAGRDRRGLDPGPALPG